MSLDKLKKIPSDTYAILGYVALSAVLTYPLIANITKFLPQGYDVWWNVWWMWWIKKSLIGLHVSPFFTEYTFHPTGTSLFFDSTNLANFIAAIPLQSFLGSIAAYNLLSLLAFVLSGYGIYLLAKYLTGDKKSSFIAGIIYTFSSYHFIHFAGGHLDIISMQWIPLYVLFLIKMVKEKGMKNAVFAAVFLALAALSTWYYMMYLAVFTAVFLTYCFFRSRSSVLNFDFIKKFCLMAALFGLIVSPIAYPMMAEKDGYASTSRSVFFSADLLGFFVPSPIHPIFGEHTKNIYKNFSGNIFETANYVGFTVLFLALYSAINSKRKEINFWLICSIIFLVLSLGPVLHINGNMLIPYPGIGLGNFVEKLGVNLPDRHYEFLENQTPREALNNNIVVPLPYAILQQTIPFFSVMRAPARFAVLVMLSLAIASAFGLKELFKRSKKRELLFAAIICLIIFESISIPFSSNDVSIPDFYKKISKEEGDYALIEVPFKAKSMYYQTVHEKKLVYGYVSRTPFSVQEFIGNTPLIRELSLNSLPYQTNQTWYGKPEINADDPYLIENGLKILKEYNIKYVVVHKDDPTPQVFENVSTLLKNIFKREPMKYEKDNIFVYEVR